MSKSVEILEMAGLNNVVNAEFVRLALRDFVCIQRQNNVVSISLQVVDEVYYIEYKLFPNVGLFVSRGNEEGMLLIVEAKAAFKLLAWTSICCQNGESFVVFAQIAQSRPSAHSRGVE